LYTIREREREELDEMESNRGGGSGRRVEEEEKDICRKRKISKYFN